MDFPIDKNEALAMLSEWGYLRPVDALHAATAKKMTDPFKRAVADFKARWGDKYNLPYDDVLDQETADLMRRRFCSAPDMPLSVGGLRRWSSHRLTWSGNVRVGSLSFVDAQKFTRDQTKAACNMVLELVGSESANIVSTDRRIDGPGSVLARAWLPGTPSGPNEQRRQEYDNAEVRLSQKAFSNTVLHETGHSLGLGHDQGPEIAMMDPFLNESLDGWQAPDIMELVARYGDPVGTPTPPDNPTPRNSFILTLEVAGDVDVKKLEAAGFHITRN